jgi:predicted nucleic acid-binding protein
VDTCVVSENLRPAGEQRVKDRVRLLRSRDTFLSVITIGEIAKGAALLEPGRKRDRITDYLNTLERSFARRILGIDPETARIWGDLTAHAKRSGRVIPPTDGLIAATARQHGLHVMTRNVRDFEDTGVLIINPWEDA